jgi:hypothetical protein
MAVRALTPVLAAVLSAGTAFALAACGSSGAPAAPSGQAQAGPAAASQAAGSVPGTSTTKKINVCADLPLAMASQITGTKFSTAKPDNVENVVFGCDYNGPDGALLQISVITEDGADALAGDISALKAVGHAPDPISGVGDKAFSEPNPNGNAGSIGAAAAASYGAVFGSNYIKIGGLTYVNPSQGKQIVEQINSKL